MKNLNTWISLIIALLLPFFVSGCIMTKSVEGETNNIETEDSIAATDTKMEPEPTDRYELLLRCQEMLQQGNNKLCLKNMADVFPEHVDRRDLQVPYIKIPLNNDYIGFAFYNDLGTITDIVITNRLLTLENMNSLVINKSTTMDVFQMNPNAILSPMSIESITAHILQEGVYIIRCSNSTRKIISVEFVPNEKIPIQGLQRYGMTIPYILPEDKCESGDQGDG